MADLIYSEGKKKCFESSAGDVMGYPGAYKKVLKTVNFKE